MHRAITEIVTQAIVDFVVREHLGLPQPGGNRHGFNQGFGQGNNQNFGQENNQGFRPQNNQGFGQGNGFQQPQLLWLQDNHVDLKWWPEAIGFFDPDLSKEYRSEDYVMVRSHTYWRDVYLFTKQI